MTKESILKLLHILGAKKLEHKSGQWVKCSCPFAPWWHKHEVQKTTSFGVKVNTEGPSQINCFACQATGDVLDMVMQLRHLNSVMPHMELNIGAALQLIANEELEEEFDAEFPSYEELTKVKKVGEFWPFDEHWLSSFQKRPNHNYLQYRGISEAAATKLDARWDTSEDRICFPIRTMSGVLAGLQGRKIWYKDQGPFPEELLRYKLYSFKGHYNPSVWAGEHLINLSLPVVITEGWLDLAKIFMAYENVCASLTSKITKEKAIRLQDATHIITLYDNGTGGDTARELANHYWPNSVIDHIIPDEVEDDAGNMSPMAIGQYIEGLL